MSIEIRRDRELLHVSGSIETILTIPPRARADDRTRFTLALSDGTLVEGVVDDTDICRFAVAIEGAGITRIAGSGEPALRHEWAVEWIAISAADQAARAESGATELPLFPDLQAVEGEATDFAQGSRLERIADKLGAGMGANP